jgi:hypothetical protein
VDPAWQASRKYARNIATDKITAYDLDHVVFHRTDSDVLFAAVLVQPSGISPAKTESGAHQ